MWSSSLLKALVASALAIPVLTQTSSNSSVAVGTYPFNLYTLTAGGVTAKFIPYGARLTSLLVPDRDGTYQDVVVGYDNATQYLTDTESKFC